MRKTSDTVRWMGLDYGTKTVGVAVSDELLLTVRALEIIRREKANHLRKTLARIAAICGEQQITKIVVGWPLHMDMSESPMARQAADFSEAVFRRTGIETVLWDERLTSEEAANLLRMNGIKAENEKEYIDMVAAKVILESYLEHCREEEN